jgi:hypothetical protein
MAFVITLPARRLWLAHERGKAGVLYTANHALAKHFATWDAANEVAFDDEEIEEIVDA